MFLCYIFLIINFMNVAVMMVAAAVKGRKYASVYTGIRNRSFHSFETRLR